MDARPLDELEQVDWAALAHRGWGAEQIPAVLRGVAAGETGVSQSLFDVIVSPPERIVREPAEDTLPFLLHLVQQELPALDELLRLFSDLLGAYTMSFAELRPERVAPEFAELPPMQARLATVQSRARAALPIAARLLSHARDEVRLEAAALLGWGERGDHALVAALENAASGDPSGVVSARAMLSLEWLDALRGESVRAWMLEAPPLGRLFAEVLGVRTLGLELADCAHALRELGPQDFDALEEVEGRPPSFCYSPKASWSTWTEALAESFTREPAVGLDLLARWWTGAQSHRVLQWTVLGGLDAVHEAGGHDALLSRWLECCAPAGDPTLDARLQALRASARG